MRTVLLLAALGLLGAPKVAAQAVVGREAALALRPEPIRFEPPEPERHEVHGVPVLYLRDPAVPLTTVLARFRGGYSVLDRDRYAAAVALPSLLRYGGTVELPPDSVDKLLEFYALDTSFGGGGETVFASLNTLTRHLPTALGLWGSLLRSPRFDSAQIEVWRGRQLEDIRRRADDPGRLAFSEFNRLMYGDHPIGWEMEPADLVPERLSREIFEDVHGFIVCAENLTLGATGDLPWSELRPLFEELLSELPSCTREMTRSPLPEIRREPGVFLLPKELEQSVIVMAHPTSVRMADDDAYYSVQIGNAILGGGGFSSRILSRVRTEEGYAYSASSLWTTPRRFDGIVGAITRTRPENTLRATRLILEILDEARDAQPEDDEVETAVDRIVNGFVFNFETPAQIISRRMFYLAQDLPTDWLERFLAGVQRVTPRSVHRVFRAHLRPDQMTILILGDPDRIDLDGLAELGPVTRLALPER